MRLCLFEDRGVAGLAPLAVARPAFDLLCGPGTLKDGLVRWFQSDSLGYLVRAALAPSLRRREPHAPVNDPRWLRASPAILANARWIPPNSPPVPLGRDPHLALCNGEIAYAKLTADQLAGVSPQSLDDCFEDWKELLPRIEVGGCVVGGSQDLLIRCGERIAAEFSNSTALHNLPPGVALVGPSDRLHLDRSAAIEPMVMLDTTRGPIILEAGVRIRAFSRIEGPCAIGAGSDIRADLRGNTVFGPKCRISGTVENSIALGYATLGPGCAFDGAYLGEGVSAGPGTLCESTGGAAVVVGDFAQLSAGVLLDRGTAIGAFARVAAAHRFAPHAVPAFGRISGDGIETDVRVNRHLHDIAEAMAAVGRAFDPAELDLYRELALGAADAGHRTLPLPFRRAG